jgi:uncharacterized protein
MKTENNLKQKEEKLRCRLQELQKTAIAFSGGVDSSVLLKIALTELGKENVLAFTAAAPFQLKRDKERSHAFARSLGIEQQTIALDFLMQEEEFTANSELRCYYCKKFLWQKALNILPQNYVLVDGTNAGDLREERKGLMANKEMGIVSPLAEAGLTKQEVRALAYAFEFDFWNEPASACLATRFPQGYRITEEGLEKAEAAEEILHDAGYKKVRVRIEEDTARIEIDPFFMVSLVKRSNLDAIVRKIKDLGFRYVTLDLAGYGS